ncbi:hypothetical protein TNCV_1168981 [Trichonephila clavipes]|uniref:Uncharacterized protein n=1 Tax=Trichonephila clavipes TaxID=2585209 RepID=A0A8X6VPJ4_TRICX|nr:hypothetical protein TNCV_1168981 [Trichonephila clavipes]
MYGGYCTINRSGSQMPSRVDRVVSGYQLVAQVVELRLRNIVPLMTRCVEGLMNLKIFNAESPAISAVWKFGVGASSGIVLVSKLDL